jgi:hypothetical protein
MSDMVYVLHIMMLWYMVGAYGTCYVHGDVW